MNNTTPALDLERFDVREVISAAPDYFAHAFGQAMPGRTIHPLASAIDIPTICAAFATANNVKSGSSLLTVVRGSTTSGFIRLLQESAGPVVLQAYQRNAQRPFAAETDLSNFMPQPVYAYNVADGMEHVPANSEYPRSPAFSASAGHATAEIRSYGRIFSITGDNLLTGEVDGLLNLLRGAGASVAQLEAGLLAAALENPRPLSDGAAFDATNIVAQALSAETLGMAVGMLRNQGAPGRPLNIQARHIVTHPDLELLARKLVRDADLSAVVQVSVLPGLASGRWLVLGDPELVPSLTLARLGGRVPVFKVQRSFDSDGVYLRISTKADAVIASRIGIVRGGA